MPDIDYGDDEPGMKTVFKAIPLEGDPKHNASRNSPQMCSFPGCEVRALAGKTLPACSACKQAQCCSKEHQKQHWAAHRDRCKETRRLREIDVIKDALRPRTEGMPTLQALKLILEDWIELHRITLEGAFAAAIHFAGKEFNYHTMYAEVTASYRPESEGNPGMAFLLHDIALRKDRRGMEDFRVEVENTHAMRDQLFPPEYAGYLMVNYIYHPDARTFITATAIMRGRETSLGGIITPSTWITKAKANVANGKVYRAVRDKFDPRYSNPVIGKMKRQGNKWVWNKT